MIIEIATINDPFAYSAALRVLRVDAVVAVKTGT
jgi:hypothetical protein